MQFKYIELDTWKRKEHFEHFLDNIPCTYSMTVNLDISKLRRCNLKLYPTMLYLISTVVNKHEEFRMSLDDNDRVGVFDMLNPCYTVFHKDSETFSNIWTEYDSNYQTFCNNYDTDIRFYSAIKEMDAKPNTPVNIFPVSMIPWSSFTSFNLNLPKSYKYLLPIFTIGKYYQQDEKIIMPIAIQVHHAVCDGFHISRFIEELQILINKFKV